METKELIARINALGVESSYELTASALRKLVHDGVLTPAPRSAKSSRKGRPPSDWPEEAVAEIAAYLIVKKMDEKHVRTSIPKRSIKEVRLVSQNIRNEPWKFCPVSVDNDGDIDLDPQHRWVRFELLRPVRIPKELIESGVLTIRNKTEFDVEIARDSLLEEVEQLLHHFQHRKKQDPKLFSKDESYDIDYLSESVEIFRRQFAHTHELPDFEFTFPFEVTRWLATYEKVLDGRPLSVPLRIDYRWMIDITFKKKPTTLQLRKRQETMDRASHSKQGEEGQRANIAYTLDVVALNSSYRGNPVLSDSVNVQYRVKKHYEDEGVCEST